ncbi:hypothetical protein NE683_08090 [Bariatricus massiliensis]|uniref:Uncharacterized protein n=1 Tax=Bariatricus massiliensis TaxID=1745713 RepID=A0ABS8DJW6_9FIRM|nr:hypothetical protein [Bariatricus massiliensis]MCB7305623.1 hypothetical protein [Bariatricus massiliensis]MCB7376177.1 hypothetical protein [Bariatricus massiliensis]MCB7388709.1 hypothetical protein [Bariatricus massiliensis]MCB7412882.1 hypothetical protein [Bariatricus massiliensis]MCQ5253188.1 hypothetical protein [Bariatricus massiliensis]
MKMIWCIATGMLLVSVIATGIILKIYTNGKLKDIDGISPVIKQELGQGSIIDQF